MCTNVLYRTIQKKCKQVQQKKNFNKYLQNKNLVRNKNACFDIITIKIF